MPSDRTRLESWKEIAAYLNREVRTVRRWEKERGLPVHRMPGKRSGVYALAPEIDAWLKTEAPIRSNANDFIEVTLPLPRSTARRLAPWATAGGALLLAVAMLFGLAAARSPVPRLSHAVNITNDGRLKGGPIAGGRSLFFNTLGPEPRTLKRIGESGELSVIPFQSNSSNLLAVSRDGSQVLVGQVDSDGQLPLWVVPTAGRSPRRLAGLHAEAAAWSPDGSTLAFATGRDLYLVNGDGRNSHRLVVLPFERPREMRFSPDVKRLRLILREGHGAEQFDRLWEVDVNKATVTRALPAWSLTPSDIEFGGEWTPDERFFIFAAVHQGTSAIWAEKSNLLAWRDAAPVRLTELPEQVQSIALSGDGKKVFANVPLPLRGELLRFDARVGRFLPYTQMSGLSGGQLTYSPDGKRVAYATYPEPSIWTMNADGKGRLPLALRGALPQWSPDGQRIAYMGLDKWNPQTKIRIVPAAGGRPQEPVQWPGWQGAPNWASGGTELIFGENGSEFPIAPSCSLHVFDFKSGKTTDLPGTTGLWTPRVCPSGRYVAAQTRDNHRLVLYDRRTATVTELLASSEGKLGDNPIWSADGRFVYIDTAYSHDPAVYRIRVADRRIERVASLTGYRRVEGGIGVWLGLTLEVVYESGVLRPLEPLPFAERQHLVVTVTDELRPKPAFNAREREQEWLRLNRPRYPGQWSRSKGTNSLATAIAPEPFCFKPARKAFRVLL